nr:uncharacterized mitochondrial protein AtMg00810-like [Tanacetum cinerariifolium]
MASASPICLMARASSTKSWLWHQQLSHLNFDTINDLARIDLVEGLPKFKYYKEHLCPSCEQGKSQRASHPPKLVPNSRQRLHPLHMDLCGPMRIASINGKQSKDEAPEVIIKFLKWITVLLHSKPRLNSMTSGHISSRLDLTYAPSTITMQQPSEGELDLLFEAMYDDYIGGRPSATVRTVSHAQEPQTKDHPLEQVIGEPSRPVLTRNQLRSDGDMYMYVLLVSSMEPKNVKEAMTDLAWIDSIPDIVHTTCLCARYQAKPTEKHLKEVKRIFRYLQGTVNTSLWYMKDSSFELTGFSYADYAGCKDTFKSTFGGAQFLGEKL